MKNAIISIGLILIMIVSLCGILSIVTNITRTNELEENINTAAYQTMDKFFIDNVVEDNEENEKNFISDFTSNLLNLTDSDSDINVKVVRIDLSNGAFRVKVTEKYKGMFKRNKTIKVDRTLILDFSGKEMYKKNSVTVTFYWDDNTVVKKIKATPGDLLAEPSKNIIESQTLPEGKTKFVGWIKEKTSDKLTDFTKEKVADSDTNYYAVFE